MRTSLHTPDMSRVSYTNPRPEKKSSVLVHRVQPQLLAPFTPLSSLLLGFDGVHAILDASVVLSMVEFAVDAVFYLQVL